MLSREKEIGKEGTGESTDNTYRNSEQGHFRCPLWVSDDSSQGRNCSHIRKGKGNEARCKVSRGKAGICLARRCCKRRDNTQRSCDKGTHTCPQSCTGTAQRSAMDQHQDTEYYEDYTWETLKSIYIIMCFTMITIKF